MDILTYLWDWIVPFLVVLTILVFVHELGHYLIARRAGVRVEVFSIGFGPEIFGWTDRHETRWKISAIPLGGYVKMFGEHDFDDEDPDASMTAAQEAVSFHHKTLGQRAAIVSAGPIANFLFAIVLLAGLYGLVGVPQSRAGIGEVVPDSAAAEGGLQAGDTILRIGDKDVVWFTDLQSIVQESPDVPLEFVVQRDGSEITLTATPRPFEVEGEEGREGVIGLLGVRPDPEQSGYVRLNPLEAALVASERTFDLTAQILVALWQILSGTRTAEELGGPLRIAQISGEMAQGGIVHLVLFMAALSINLGLINLFPIPMLDGGHLAFYAVEAVRGKPLNKRVQEYGFRFGLILVLLLLMFATWNDLTNLKVLDFFRELIS